MHCFVIQIIESCKPIRKHTIYLLFFLLSIQYIGAQSSYSTDTDNDGVIDYKDLNDDNDGIFDTQENRKRKTDVTLWTDRVNVQCISNNISFRRGYSGWSNGTTSVKASEMGL